MGKNRHLPKGVGCRFVEDENRQKFWWHRVHSPDDAVRLEEGQIFEDDSFRLNAKNYAGEVVSVVLRLQRKSVLERRGQVNESSSVRYKAVSANSR